ncbi:hypothetical protein LCGC14_0377900 [marine sediment metagenome]|uniref:Uncharacterized protein n=1 Tax=marine sediment metagenome TaxID=412755 RepID=A0A0F9TL84_9ZZZZ
MTNMIILSVTIILFIIILVVSSIRIDKQRTKLYKQVRFWEEVGRVEKEIDLLCALSEYLLPLKKDMDRLNANVEGRHAVVKISGWPEQHALGIIRCCGFELDWKESNE